MQEQYLPLKFELISLDIQDYTVNPYDPSLLIKLTLAKDLFCSELPRMPKDYVTRLVFNPYHSTMCLFEKSQNPLVGGICFRRFPQYHLAEIAFCAVSSTRKYMGYGACVMNYLKGYLSANGYTDIVTYADNSAIDFFAKMGFSRKIYLSEQVWHGRVKHYDGATFVQCKLYAWDYQTTQPRIMDQREAVLQRIGVRMNQCITIQDNEYELARCRNAAIYAISQIISYHNALPFLEKQALEWSVNIVWNDLKVMLRKAKINFYRTPRIFKEHAKSIYERCANYNGDAAEITRLGKELYEQISWLFDKAYEGRLQADELFDV